MNIHVILWAKSNGISICFVAQIVLTCLLGMFVSRLLFSFDLPPSDLEHFPPFWLHNVFQTHIFPALSLPHYLSKQPWFLLLGNGVYKPRSGHSCAHCDWRVYENTDSEVLLAF